MRRRKHSRSSDRPARVKARRPKVPLARRLTHHLRSTAQTAALLIREPRQAPGLVRRSLTGLWRARGGGLYGLGFVITFVVLEVQTFVQQWVTSTSVVSFVSAQLLEFVFRFASSSFVNTFIALVWPVLVLDKLGGTGIVLLAVGFIGYERWLRPLVERFVPELRRAPPADVDLPTADAAPADAKAPAAHERPTGDAATSPPHDSQQESV